MEEEKRKANIFLIHDIGVRADAERHIAETCATNIDKFTSNKSRPINQSSLSELFITFLAKVTLLITAFLSP